MASTVQLSPIHPQTLGFFDVTAGFAKEKPHTVAKAVAVTMGWLKELDLVPEENKETASQIQYHASLVKLARAPGNILQSINGMYKSGSDLLSKRSWKEGCEVIKESTSLFNSVWDGVDFLSRAILFLPRKAPAFVTGSGCNGIALAAGNLVKIPLHIAKIYNSKIYSAKKDSAEYNAAHKDVISRMISIASAVTYVAIGALVVLNVFFAFVFSPYIWLSLSVATIALSFTSYFQKNLGKEVGD
ncbi:MAG: hypothetical protein KR126chlam1_00974 [Chlamydiae bacterium]|nr:hypothetical protein [Chlamydiota bacterium]